VGKYAGRARELALTARTITADTALSYGLVTEVVTKQGDRGREQVTGRAIELAKEIARKSTLAASGSKRVMVWGMGKTVAEGLEYVAVHNAATLYSHDLQV
jgi:enoyl-CoA hydratase/carnithine racemase